MAIYEGSHGKLLQGVSQQVPISRLEGQVTEQINMVSDPVTGLRRRQGCKVQDLIPALNAEVTKVKAWRTEVGGAKVEFILCTTSGMLRIFENGTLVKTESSDYLKADNIKHIKQATVGESLYILNDNIIPEGVVENLPDGNSVGESGFSNFLSGALNRKFEVSVRVTTDTTVKEIVGSYTTPKGEQAEDVNKITPEYISEQIFNDLKSKATSAGLNSQITIYRTNEVIGVISRSGSKVRVLANASDTYVVTSNLGNLKNVGQLPDRFPDEMNGAMYSIGKDKGIRYYTFNKDTGSWKETSDGKGYKSIKDMPVEVYFDTDKNDWVISSENFAGRLAGDSEGNPDPDFIGWGITGISSYQGRLVLLSGSYVWLSASGLPRVFYRTTLEELLDTDPIGIGSSSATSASFQYALNTNKDLVLFSSEHQAIIAGSNVAITPRTANIAVTSTYTSDMTTEPISLGRSVMYPMPRSSVAFGVMEMLPSPYADSMYISTDVTEHIPTYLRGRCRIAVSSTVGSIALLGSTSCLRTLYVHEYMWSGEEKVLKSWHKWIFSKDIADVYFNGDLITIIFVENGLILKTTVDPRAYTNDTPEVYLDFNNVIQVSDGKASIGSTYSNFLGDVKVNLTHSEGGLSGSLIGYDREGNVFKVNRAVGNVPINIGVPFESLVTPTSPTIRDADGNPVATNRLNLINYYCTTAYSGTYTVTVEDKSRESLDIEFDRVPVKWYSTEFNLGTTPIGGITGDVIPCRVPANSSEVTFSTDGVSEFNIVTLEYVCKYNFRRQRR